MTKSLFEEIMQRVRIMGIVLVFVGGTLYAGRRRFPAYLSTAVTSMSCFLGKVKQDFVRALTKEQKTHLIAFFSILIGSIIVRGFFLARPMGYDEAWTFEAYASKPLLVGLSYYSGPNNHLFHTFLVHLSYLLAGNKPWVIRLPAFFAGVLLVPISYILSRIFYNKHVAILTGAVVAFSAPLILYSTEARGYSLICLFSLLIFTLAPYLKRSDQSGPWILFAVLSALGFYTIPIMIYPFGIVVTWLVISIALEKDSPSKLLAVKYLSLSLIGVVLMTFSLYTPVFVVSGMESVVANRFVESQPWSVFLSELPGFARSLWQEWHTSMPSPVEYLLAAGFLTSLFAHKWTSKQRTPIIVAAVTWICLVLVIHPVVRYTRVWIFLLPLYIIMAHSGLSIYLKWFQKTLKKYRSLPTLTLALIISFWMCSNVMSERHAYWEMKWAPPEAEPISLFLKDYLRPGDAVVSKTHLDVPLAYYFHVHDVPVSYLSADPNASQRMLLIVYEPGRRDMNELLSRRGVNPDLLSVPEEIKRFRSFALYESKRVDTEKQITQTQKQFRR
ncbi:MAG: glycosyltransferase family 39 protein [Desulfobacterales bacterium]|nr:MAG: glycosyltransferase family 39 protein [Desulfobacterales bacterium]